ncbi:MAG: ComEC/Rec2 family competence protein [Candidatus Delongbacteria bacterium]|nr:ComEC/Rec2 family competence protein [Candidatus Delongbacteria bacterium]
MHKRPDNIALFSFLSAGVYFSCLIMNNPLFFPILLLIGSVFFVWKNARMYIAVFLIGSVIFLIKNYDFILNKDVSDKLSGQEISVVGDIFTVNEYSLNSILTVRADTVYANSKAHSSNMKFNTVVASKGIKKGDRIKISGEFDKFQSPTNLYEKDMTEFSFINNISGEINNPKLDYLKKKESVYRKIASFQDYIIRIFDKRLSFKAGNFLSAVMMGRRDKLESSVIKDFADSGTIHLLAVSGLHVGFLVMILSLLSSVLNLKGALYIILNSSALFGYAVFTGGSPSVIRAVLMAVIFMISFPLKRKLKFIDIIGSAGIISLIYDPNQIFSTGFILSFGAVASIALIHEPISKKINETVKIENYIAKKVCEGIILSFSVTIGLLPFVLYMFGKYNFLSIISNLILIPLTGAAFLSGILLILFDKIDILAQFISDIINLCVFIISKIVVLTADLEIFTLRHKFDISVTVLLISAIIMVFYLKNYRSKFTYQFASLSSLH